MKAFRRPVGTIGGPGKEIPDERIVREERIRFARSNDAWHEVDASLVRRGPSGRYLVDAESDAVFVLRRGVVFEPGRARPGFVDPNQQMFFYVDDRGGGVFFLERPFGSRTWSQVFEVRERAAQGLR